MKLSEIPTPALVVDLPAMERNIQRMAEFFAGSGCKVRPHFKAHKTPAIVPDYGGVAAAIEAGGETGGLRFRVWDSAHLADRIAALIEDETLYQRLAEAGPRVAAHYSVSRLADRILAHIDLPPTPPAPAEGR